MVSVELEELVEEFESGEVSLETIDMLLGRADRETYENRMILNNLREFVLTSEDIVWLEEQIKALNAEINRKEKFVIDYVKLNNFDEAKRLSEEVENLKAERADLRTQLKKLKEEIREKYEPFAEVEKWAEEESSALRKLKKRVLELGEPIIRESAAEKYTIVLAPFLAKYRSEVIKKAADEQLKKLSIEKKRAKTKKKRAKTKKKRAKTKKSEAGEPTETVE